MYIEPNTTIHILKNIPLNKSYEHTVYYKTKEEQAEAFLKYKKFTLTNYSYQRSFLGTLRVELTYEQLYDCDYMMFKNTNFENKWFYAFITGVSYISNSVSEIYYEIDVMQSWCYDYDFFQCFVDRQHSKTDYLYENTQPEGLELGPKYKMIKSDRRFLSGSSTSWVIIATTTVNVGIAAFSGIITGVYTGLNVYYLTNKSDVDKVIFAFKNAGQESAIVAFYQAPRIDAEHITTLQSENVDFTQQLTLANGYKPKNKKLLSSPYTYLQVYSTLGVSAEYEFDQAELHGSKTLNFRIDKTVFPQAMAVCVPLNAWGYAGSNFENSVAYSVFPTCAFSGDAFKAWWAQNKNSYMANLNSIKSNYDTNVQIASMNYEIGQRSAQATATASKASIDTQLSNAEASNNTALSVNEKNRQMEQLGNMMHGATGLAAGLSTGNVLGAATSVIDAGMAMAQTEVNAQNVVQTLNTNMNNATASANTATANTQLALSTAMKNAATSQAAANLSALTSSQNATAALVAKKQDIQHTPNAARGNAMCDGMNYARNSAGFEFRQWGISEEYARKCDMYFEKYGYSQAQMYKPDRMNGRKYWCYLKTVGCNLNANMNQTDIITIQGIYNNGVTTWDKLEDVGHYELDNHEGVLTNAE